MIETLNRQTPSIPRKGTETLRLLFQIPLLVSSVRHPQFPARGRKLTLGAMPIHDRPSDTLNSPQGDGNQMFGAGELITRLGNVRHPQFPARGRKHTLFSSGLALPLGSDTLNSPQGDGNVIRWNFRVYIALNQSDTLNSPQGDGNLTAIGQWHRGHRRKSDTLNSPQGDGNGF